MEDNHKTNKKLPTWIPKEDLEYNFERQEPNYEHHLFCEFLKEQDTPKAKKLLEEMQLIDNNDDWLYHRLDLKFKALLKSY
ncbi:hypothetical protein [Gelidibacter salicanalis]|uniref:Uncharacterized protein n=1 Tax=Gelidibacter salicanalis TaxID=291193 RepID=A0A934KUL5_9FLAO|nr:hypothetical protein [Gelidibacter salicanalis]MBJ7882305.1 hypothetical protein [Gelidibacter salicanalis]